MYTTDRAEQALDDIRKVFLLYERDIIDKGTVKDLTNRILDLYVTDTVVVPKVTGQSCKTCSYYCSGSCKANNSEIIVDPNNCCDWYLGIRE